MSTNECRISEAKDKIFEKSSKMDKKKKINYEEPADFETAISAAGFGKFNLLLYVIALFAGWANVFESTAMSYVFPAAECDLNLQLSHKGLLNAITYLGMIPSAFFWGFLCDTLGRKKLLLIGLGLDALFVIISACSQSFAMLMTAKFFGGFIINGPFAALTTYLSEFHAAEQRARVQVALGIIFSFGNLVLPALAIAILPLNIRITINETFNIYSWNIFLFVCALSPLISFIGFMFVPETPKFLMTMGQNEKALSILKKVYRINTGKPEETFPVTKLIDETELNKNQSLKHGGKITSKRGDIQALQEGWQQIKPLFFPPHLMKILLVCSINCFIMMSLNTLRLWLPQLFQIVNDYEATHNETASLCEMMATIAPDKNKTEEIVGECVVNTDNYQVYTNSMIVSAVMILSFMSAGFFINVLGKKKILYIATITAGAMSISLYFTRNMAQTISIASLYTGLGSVTVNVLVAVVVDLFPTTLRTMTVSLTMMCGRTGAAVGNLIFPFLLESGCAPPFFFCGSLILICGLLSYLLPNTDQKALE